MRIKQISVTNLFGIFNYEIPLHLEDHITIIHGPNGFGKTALLRILDGLFNQRYSQLHSIPFEEFKVDFDDGSYIQVKRAINEARQEKRRQAHELTATVYRPGLEKQTLPLIRPRKENDSRITEIIDDNGESHSVYRVGPNTWQDIESGHIFHISEIRENLITHVVPTKIGKEEAQRFDELRKNVRIRFIETQRLLNRSTNRPDDYSDEPKLQPAVITYSQELARTIQRKLAEYGALSQSLDRTFPVRLVGIVAQNEPTALTTDLTNESLQNQFSALEEKRMHLMEAGLLDKHEDIDSQITKQVDERTRNVLAVYIQDVEQKLSVFDEEANKIDLLKKIINERFLYKKMSISKDKGFTFTTYDNKPLPATDLSSGEQHELVLLYELLFKVKSNTLILIDEPELSLHVAWQEQFLKDLQEIIGLTYFDVLIATHSPQIIFDRWDLTVELKGPIG